MSPPFLTFLAVSSLATVGIIGQLVANSRFLSRHNAALAEWAQAAQDPAASSAQAALQEGALARTRLYEVLIKQTQLEDGMIVVRAKDGSALDMCDSLLFSALRYVALRKLGLDSDAEDAWAAISKSQHQGHWQRHPRCAHFTSRDMLFGVLAAFTQDPPEVRPLLVDTLRYIKENGGYLSHGPFHVSLVSPAAGEVLRTLALGQGIPESLFPTPVSLGFSTIEFESLSPQPGYVSHLVGLNIWIERELRRHKLYRAYASRPRTAVSNLSPLTAPFTPNSLHRNRAGWAARQLHESAPENLFFKWLRLETAGALSPLTRAEMLRELMAMPQFPSDRLPQDCDRQADYLWQRSQNRYTEKSETCSKTFPGVDFLWMVALLTDPTADTPLPNRKIP